MVNEVALSETIKKKTVPDESYSIIYNAINGRKSSHFGIRRMERLFLNIC